MTETNFSQASKENSKWHLIEFFSKSLSSIEHNYEIYNKKNTSNNLSSQRIAVLSQESSKLYGNLDKLLEFEILHNS